jgi:glycosyltransferase involved in cell wall biosynthesis
MKIALCAPADIHSLAHFTGQDTDGIAPGLGGTATTPLVAELLNRGHDVTLYTLSKGLAKEQVYRFRSLRVFVGPFRERRLACTYYWPEIGYLQRVIRADTPAFVHAHWTYECALGSLRSGVPTVTTIHDLPWNVLRYYRDPHRAVRLLMAYEVALRGRHFTAVSEGAALHFTQHIKPGAKIEVIPNGLSDEVFALGRHPRQESGIGIAFATILQGWSRRKNAETALKAFDILRHQLPGARLVMFGIDYERGGRAHQWAKNMNLDRNVFFAGPVPYSKLLQRVSEEVDVVVHPSLDEAFSMAALETMALRKALIAGETTPGMREMFGSGGGGLVDVKSPTAIAQSMLQLATNADYRHHLSNRSYERAFKYYRLSSVVDHYEALYRRMLQVQTARTPAIQSAAKVAAAHPHVPLGA